MKNNFTIMGVFILVLSTPSYSAGWVTDHIARVEVAYGNGCVALSNGEQAILDLETSAGRTEFSLALSAKIANKQISIYQNDNPLVGGCNTGSAIKGHSILRLNE